MMSTPKKSSSVLRLALATGVAGSLVAALAVPAMTAGEESAQGDQQVTMALTGSQVLGSITAVGTGAEARQARVEATIADVDTVAPAVTSTGPTPEQLAAQAAAQAQAQAAAEAARQAAAEQAKRAAAQRAAAARAAQAPAQASRTQVRTAPAPAAAAPAAAPAPAAPAPAPAANGSIVGIAASLSGIPYVWGGTSLRGFDCAGFTQYVYAQAGKSIPRTANGQQAAAIRVTDPQPGDLVFFGYPAYHVGIYAGPGKLYDAQRTGTFTGLHNIWTRPSGYGRF